MKIKRLLALMLVLAMMAGLLVAPVSAADSKFTDTGSHWAKTSIERWAEAGIINGSENKPNGVGNGTFSFRPNDPITRGEFAKILTYVMGLTKPAENVFSDLNDSHWYKNDVLLCVNAGIINGYGNEKDGYTFRGGKSITRAEAASMLIRAFNAKEGTVADLEAKNFKDFNLLKDHWAKGALAGAVNYSALGGYGDGTLKPDAEITRAEVCVMLDRLAAVYVSKTGEVSTTTQGEIDKNNTGNFVIVSAECTDDVVITADKDNKITVTVGEQKADITVQNGVAPTVVVEKQTQELPKDETPVQVDGKDEKDEDDKAEIHTHDYTYTSNDNGTHNGACACGKDAITNEACEYKDGICVKCGFKLVAKDANGTYYTDLQEAVDAGGEVTLLKSVELENYVTITKTLTLNLNGYCIERTKGTVLYINAEDAVVTIQGEGTVTGDHAVYVGAGKAVIQSGTFAGGSHAVYVQGAGKAEIYGGTFSAVPDDNGTYFVLNQYDSDRATSSITVYGGTYANFNPANNLAENAGTNFVAEGYESVAGDDNTWTVRQIAE